MVAGRMEHEGSPAPAILVIEDMALVAAEIERQVKQLGYRVAGVFATLDSALAAVGEGIEADAALLDVNLAGRECFPVAEALEERGIPFCFLTGYLSDYLPAKYKGVRVLEKPFSRADLQRALEEMVAAPHSKN